MSRPITIYGKDVPSGFKNRVDKDVIDILYGDLTDEEKELLEGISYVFVRVLKTRDRRRIDTTEFIHYVKEFISIK